MFNFDDIISENFSSYPEETQEFMKKYTEVLKENLINGLIENISDSMLKDIDKSKDYFMDVLSEILTNGCKGFSKMSTRTLVNMYLEKKGEEEFFKLLEKINNEVD